jgi:hypothetical protein
MITIVESKLLFKSPNVGQATKAISDHYNGRRVVAMIDDERRIFRFEKDELDFYSEEEDMVRLIQEKESK